MSKTPTKNKEKEIAISQKKELENWDKKLKSGEAYKEVKNFIMNLGSTDFDPDFIIRKIARDIFPKIGIKREDISKEDDEVLNQAMLTFGVENHLSMLEAVENRYRGLIMNLRKNLVKDFDCKTYIEKALVDIIVNAYSRVLSCSKMLVNTTTVGHTTKELNNFMSIMSKEVDRANRHYLASLETLRQLKQPDLNVNIKAKNAFVGQNQQFNNNQNKEDETVESK